MRLAATFPLLLALIFHTSGLAQGKNDVVILKDGSRLVGTILTIVPDKSVTLRLTDGTVHVLEWNRIERIEKGEEAAVVQPKLFKPGLESWYAYWGIGFASASYPDNTQNYVDEIKRLYNPTNTPLAIDMFGFYWPLADNRTLIGFVVAGSSDRYTYNAGGFESKDLQLMQLLYAGSAMHFFGEVPGDGIFVRADVGRALFRGLGDRSGLGFQVGGGYGIVVSDEARILLQTGYSYRRMDGESYGTWSLTAGCLF